MFKQILGTLMLTALCSTQAMAQTAWDSTADTGDAGHETQTTQRLQGDSQYTSTQGAGSPGGPNLEGTPSQGAGPGGSSGAATGAPFMGGFTAPANLALQAMGRKTLPPTRLESFVRNSGMNDAIYGDEGEMGLPPYFGFDPSHYINTGINMPELTTGHKSDAPSAWGYPQ